LVSGPLGVMPVQIDKTGFHLSAPKLLQICIGEGASSGWRKAVDYRFSIAEMTAKNLAGDQYCDFFNSILELIIVANFA